MRKIELQMIEAIRAQRAFKLDNTEVTVHTREDGVRVTTVYLHGNMISQNGVTGWGVKLSGWNTPTTRSRVNAILQAIGVQGRVHQVEGEPMFNGKKISATDWIFVD